MNILYFMVIATILMSAGFLFLFIFSVRRGQLENLDIESKKILLNDDLYKGNKK